MPIAILTTTISIPFHKITKSNVDKLILKKLKNIHENKCCSHGFVKENSVKIIQRSQGIIKNNDNVSYILYDINYKIDTISPLQGDSVECIINNTTKMGTIAYLYDSDKKYTLKNSPLLIIIPISDESKDLETNDKVNITVITSKLKYNSTQIQVIGKIDT